jgi:hypothetical protein
MDLGRLCEMLLSHTMRRFATQKFHTDIVWAAVGGGGAVSKRRYPLSPVRVAGVPYFMDESM